MGKTRLRHPIGLSLAAAASAAASIAAAEPANLPVPPQGFDARNNGIPHGEVDLSASYPTRNTGMQKVTVYKPPGYSTDQKYPVLYLHHGIGGNEQAWVGRGSNEGNADNVMDYLYSKSLAKPMIVVMPDGNTKDANGQTRGNNQGFEAHGDVLLNDLIPWVEKTYSAASDPDSRAIAGLSMGGGQTFNFGFPNTDVFHYIGAFSAAPNTRPPSQTISDVNKIKQDLNVIFIACGDQDGLINNSQNYVTFLEKNDVPHLWQIERNEGHTKTVWNRSLYNFAQRIFQEPDNGGSGGGGAGGTAGSGGAGGGGNGGSNPGGGGAGNPTAGEGGGAGTPAAGGAAAGAGGTNGGGGAASPAGGTATGGAPATGGATTGGAVATGGSVTGGQTSTGGQSTGGAPILVGGSTSAPPADSPADDSGCGCSVPRSTTSPIPYALGLALAFAARVRTRARRKAG